MLNRLQCIRPDTKNLQRYKTRSNLWSGFCIFFMTEEEKKKHMYLSNKHIKKDERMYFYTGQMTVKNRNTIDIEDYVHI